MTNVTKKLEKLDAGRILDVATGDGNFLKFITDIVASYSGAVGIDTKQESAAPFTSNFQGNPRVHFQLMSAEKMDFEDESFDTVCISNSLHHMQNTELVLREMLRVLKSGGHFIVNEMYKDGNQAPTQKTHILLHHWLAAVDREQKVVHNETFTRQELINFTRSLDLAQLETEDHLDLADDPKNPAIFAELEPVIQRYIDRAGGNEYLQAQGNNLMERLRRIGFHSSSSLLILAKKK